MIYCSQCGSQISVADAACPACGRALPAALNSPPASVSGSGVAVSPDRLLHPYYGVGGWLAIFIFSIVFVGPVYHIRYAIQHYTDNMELKHAKQFLIVLLLLPIAEYLIGINWLTLLISEEARGTVLSNFLAGKTARIIVRGAIYSAVWYAYLSHSERVRVTYAENT